MRNETTLSSNPLVEKGLICLPNEKSKYGHIENEQRVINLRQVNKSWTDGTHIFPSSQQHNFILKYQLIVLGKKKSNTERNKISLLHNCRKLLIPSVER